MWQRSPGWQDVTFWALDLETTGLDATRAHVLALAMLPVRRGVIAIGESYRTPVRPPAGATILVGTMRAHHLVPSDLETAPALADVLPEAIERLRHGVLLVHHAPLDVRMLKGACRRHALAWPRVQVVDTVDLIWKLARRQRYAKPGAEAERDPELNLALARRACGLPAYPAHDALTDAIATAELFLVLRHRLGARTVRDLT
jgi:DNA polymerase-3 subunit epsilon